MRGQMQFALICFWAVLAPYKITRWLLTWKNLEKSGNSRVVREKWRKTVLDLLNWTKISGTNFFLLASLAYYLYHHFWIYGTTLDRKAIACMV